MNSTVPLKDSPTVVPWLALPVTNHLNKLSGKCLAGKGTVLVALWSLRRQTVRCKVRTEGSGITSGCVMGQPGS